MANELFKNRYRISSARAPWHDYSHGTYFVTICTKNREHSFGEILNDGTGNPIMRLSSIGKNADMCWCEIPSHFPHVQTVSRVIMPNHIHGILTINPIAETQNVVAYYDETQRISDVVETQNVAIHGETQRITDGVETQNFASLRHRQPQQPGQPRRIPHVVETHNYASLHIARHQIFP